MEFNNTEAVLLNTDTFLEENPSYGELIRCAFMGHHRTSELIPLMPKHLGSGNTFPIQESATELSISYFLVRRGLYRQAVVSLRTTLELGLLSVYWDRQDNSEQKISAWVNSNQNTPMMRNIRAGLSTISAVSVYEEKKNLLGNDGRINLVYQNLNDYAHAKGARYSIGMLSSGWPGANIARFSKKTFKTWIDLANEVVKIIVITHLLKYPVGLQETPLDEKFGLNPPMGGFLNPWQADLLREFIGRSDADLLQSISDSDSNAVEIGREIRALPDLSEDEWDQHILEQNQFTIENQGYESWYSMHSSFHSEGSSEEIEKFEMRAKSLKDWATEKGWLEHGHFG